MLKLQACDQRSVSHLLEERYLLQNKNDLPVSTGSGLSCPVLLDPRLVDSGLATPKSFHFPCFGRSRRFTSVWLASESGLEPEILPSPSSKARSSAYKKRNTILVPEKQTSLFLLLLLHHCFQPTFLFIKPLSYFLLRRPISLNKLLPKFFRYWG